MDNERIHSICFNNVLRKSCCKKTGIVTEPKKWFSHWNILNIETPDRNKNFYSQNYKYQDRTEPSKNKGFFNRYWVVVRKIVFIDEKNEFGDR